MFKKGYENPHQLALRDMSKDIEILSKEKEFNRLSFLSLYVTSYECCTLYLCSRKVLISSKSDVEFPFFDPFFFLRGHHLSTKDKMGIDCGGFGVGVLDL